MQAFPTEHTDCVDKMFIDIREFTVTNPRLPSPEKDFVRELYPDIRVTDSREDIITESKGAF